MIKAVIFDLDGTLHDREQSLHIFISRQYSRFKDLFSCVDEELYKTRFIQLDNGGYVWKDKVYRQLAEELGMESISADELLKDYILNFSSCCRAFHGTARMLRDLTSAGYKLAIMTNGRSDFQMRTILSLSLEQYFQCILISEMEGIGKPGIDIFARAASKLGADPSQCVYVGDHPINDIEGAKRAGMAAVWKYNRFWSEPERVDGVLREMTELPFIIRNLDEQLTKMRAAKAE